MRSKGSNGGGAVDEIPEASRKIVRSLKEIVSCPEAEIYAMLKECAMDPNEAVNRLLSQDPFHEVKSKREKKKENKHTTESKSRSNNHSSRGNKGSSDHYVGSSVYAKPSYKKENGSSVYASHSFVSSGTEGTNVYHHPSAYSDPVSAENKFTNTDTFDNGWSSSHPSSNPSVWGGGPGQVSMADIVKMGRPHHERGSHSANQSQSISSEVSQSKVSPDDEWPVVEPYTRNSTLEQASGWYNTDQHHQELEKDEVPAVKDEYVENVGQNQDEYEYGRVVNNNSEGDSHINSDVHENVESFQPRSTAVEYREAEEAIGVSVSSVTENVQLLNIVDDQKALQEEDDCDVIIPDHLQVQSADLSHLSFGSFVSLSAGPAFSVPLPLRPTDEDAPSDGPLDARSSDYYVEESLKTSLDENLVQRPGARGAGPYDSSSVSQSEVLNQENQYTLPSSSNFSFENATQLNASFPHSQPSAPMQTFSNQSYEDTLPNYLLPKSAQSTRESDYPNASIALAQSLRLKYGNSEPSVSSSTLSRPEVLEPPRPNNIATGPAIPPHLVHQYSQMSQLTNLMGYQFMPQNYYLPDTYHQPQSANFGSSNSLPGNFLNQPSPPGASPIGYEDVLSHLLSMQQMQNENEAMWVQGEGSRTMSGIPTNTYYQQRPTGLRQTQQQHSQNYGALGNNNTNFYLSQTGNLLDPHHQQQHQNPRNGHANHQQNQHLWHDSY